jgi:curved DNA-binding protein
MQVKDYYAELNLTPEADEKAIKQAYRKLARQYHPDVNPNDQSAEERFKAVNEAYQVLSDPQKRERYDQMRQQRHTWQHFGGDSNTDWGQWQDVAGGWVYSNTVTPEDMEDVFGSSDFFSSIFGGAFHPHEGGARQARPQRGRDIDMPIEVTLDEAFHGTRRVLQVGERRIEARIPPGVADGSRVRLGGQGHPGKANGAAGDLYMVVSVAPDARFDRSGDDLTTEAAVDFYTAAVGGEVRIPTLDGTVMLKIPPQTQADKKFRLKGRGMPRVDQPEHRGDLYVRIKLVLPESLSENELDTLRELAQMRRDPVGAV